jgi:hypothetical protein
MDLSFIGELFGGGGAIGGILGAITPIVAQAQKRKQKREENAHEREMAKITLEETRLEQSHELAIADKEIDKAETEGELLIDQKEVDGTIEIIKGQANARGAKAWIRPVLTAYAMIIATVLSWAVFRSAGGLEAFTASEKVDMLTLIVDSAFLFATASFMFWFTARQIEKS